MKLGIHLPDAGNIATRENMLEVARLDDSLRFDSVFSSDHIAWPNPESIRSNYPYNDPGDFIPMDTPWLDVREQWEGVARACEAEKRDLSEIGFSAPKL